MDPPGPIDAIELRMEQQGLARKDLEALIGSRTHVAEVLNRNSHRPLRENAPRDPTVVTQL
jgi:antitoxin component HigA of HigAB toxin-antitoxin module